MYPGKRHAWGGGARRQGLLPVSLATSYFSPDSSSRAPRSGLVSGHGFSHADKRGKQRALAPVQTSPGAKALSVLAMVQHGLSRALIQTTLRLALATRLWGLSRGGRATPPERRRQPRMAAPQCSIATGKHRGVIFSLPCVHSCTHELTAGHKCRQEWRHGKPETCATDLGALRRNHVAVILVSVSLGPAGVIRRTSR